MLADADVSQSFMCPESSWSFSWILMCSSPEKSPAAPPAWPHGCSYQGGQPHGGPASSC